MKICPQCHAEYDDYATHCQADGSKLVSVDTSVEADPLVGTMLTDRIRLDTKIGEGGMGAVYKGEDTLLGRTVAVKILHPALKKNIEDVKRFFNEAKVVAKLRHPNTIRVFDFGESKQGHNYIAMEFMTGEPLEDYMNSEELTVGRIIEIVDQVCQSLDEAHAAGIIHRDLKPDNVFIDNVNNRRMVKVIDFGIAKLSGGENLTQAGMVFGTPAYMSPEQARGEKLDSRSDIYSVGVMMWHLLAGRQPFIGDNPMEVAIQHVTREPPPLHEHSRFGTLPKSLIELVETMMAKDREARPESAAAVRKVLARIARQMPDLRVDTATQMGSAIKVRTSQISVVGSREEIAPGLDLDAQPDPQEWDDELDEAYAPKRGKGGLIAVIALLVIAAAAVVFFVILPSQNTTEEPTDPSEPEVTETNETPPVEPDPVPAPTNVYPALELELERAIFAAERSATEETVTLQIASVPAGALVARSDTGDTLGTTPLTWYARRGEGALPLALTLEGYEAASTEVALGMSGAASVELSAVRVERDRDRDRDRDREEVRRERDEPEERQPERDEPEEEEDDTPSGPPRFVPRDPVTID